MPENEVAPHTAEETIYALPEKDWRNGAAVLGVPILARSSLDLKPQTAAVDGYTPYKCIP